jgi:hypothetical protein
MKHLFTAAFQSIFNSAAYTVVTRFERGRSPDRG